VERLNETNTDVEGTGKKEVFDEWAFGATETVREDKTYYKYSLAVRLCVVKGRTKTYSTELMEEEGYSTSTSNRSFLKCVSKFLRRGKVSKAYDIVCASAFC